MLLKELHTHPWKMIRRIQSTDGEKKATLLEFEVNGINMYLEIHQTIQLFLKNMIASGDGIRVFKHPISVAINCREVDLDNDNDCLTTARQRLNQGLGKEALERRRIAGKLLAIASATGLSTNDWARKSNTLGTLNFVYSSTKTDRCIPFNRLLESVLGQQLDAKDGKIMPSEYFHIRRIPYGVARCAHGYLKLTNELETMLKQRGWSLDPLFLQA